MNKKQLWAVYAILCFILLWGWSFINDLKFKGSIDWEDAFTWLHVTQLIYTLGYFIAIHWVFKKFYVERKYGRLVLGILAVLAGYIALRYFLEQFIMPVFFGISNYPRNVHIGFYILDNLYYGVIYSTLGILVFLLDNQLLSQKKEAALQQERTHAELAFLRSQVSPHFLFNALNNIYALSSHQPDKAPDAILALSNLTRYMLYEKQEKVPAEKEWNYIKSLVSLQQLRYQKPLQVNMVCEGDMQKLIEPYLLIPFVENAFKHGIVDSEARPVFIKLVIQSQTLEYRVENEISFLQKDKEGGIGLENIKRRLELLYPNRHVFNVKKDANLFTAYIKIMF